MTKTTEDYRKSSVEEVKKASGPMRGKGCLNGINEDILDANELKGAGRKELVILGQIIATPYKRLSPNVTEDDVTRFLRGILKDPGKNLEQAVLPPGHV